jgi:hypothetical protein
MKAASERLLLTLDEDVIEYYQVVVPISEGQDVIYLNAQL